MKGSIMNVALVSGAILAALGHATRVGPPGGAGGRFKPGWNGKAMTPPLGWRSWNAFGNRIYDSTIRDAIDAITAKNWTVDGKTVSLADVGYNSVGIDEGWEGCGMGVNGTQHYVNGTPAVDANFPDMKALVEYGHSKSLSMGFYENGCKCGERIEKEVNYQGDVRYLFDNGFDGVKLDGCGRQRNLTLYAELMQQTGKNYSIENCHWGDCTDSDDSSCPTTEWCPFNWYRSSGDINAGTMSWFNNLQTTIRFQTWENPVSQPGCWAYPDMLEVGRVSGSAEWNRAHFGAWCIVSAPLILGLELTQANLEPIIDVITNKDAIAVNQAWAGHPGTLVWSKTVPPPPPGPGSPVYVSAEDCDASNTNQQGWSASNNVIMNNGLCVDATNAMQLQMVKCTGAATQVFTANGSAFRHGTNGCLDVYYFNGPVVDVYGCNGGYNQKFSLGPKGTLQESTGMNKANLESGGKCLEMTSVPPGKDSGNLLQLWAKPMSKGGVAFLVINTNAQNSANATVLLSDLNVTGTMSARNIWTSSDAGTVETSMNIAVPAQDSAFMLLTPV